MLIQTVLAFLLMPARSARRGHSTGAVSV